MIINALENIFLETDYEKVVLKLLDIKEEWVIHFIEEILSIFYFKTEN